LSDFIITSASNCRFYARFGAVCNAKLTHNITKLNLADAFQDSGYNILILLNAFRQSTY